MSEVVTGEGYAVGTLDDLGDSPGFRKIRPAFGVTAFGINAVVIPAGIESGRTQFPTAAGRVIHLPVGAPHAGPNYCIQGTARELLVDALLRWRQTQWGEAVLWPVHDEIVVMVPEAEAVDATAALTACMTSELAGVPIIAEASHPSYAWADSV